MSHMFFYFFLVGVFCLILLFINFFTSLSYLEDFDKMSGFECGFVNAGDSRASFSMRYFLLTVIFVVFDIEVVLLFPGLIMVGYSIFNMVSWLFQFFLFILFVGLLYEIKEGAMSWSY